MDLTTRVEQVPNLPRYSGDKEQRTPAQYTTDLTVETERSLRRSPSWRAGRPLADHRGECDCPTLTGCVERRAWPSSNDLGGRNPDNTNYRHRSDPTHGKRATYAHGCRCQPCRDANTKHQREYQQRKHP